MTGSQQETSDSRIIWISNNVYMLKIDLPKLNNYNKIQIVKEYWDWWGIALKNSCERLLEYNF